MESSELSRPMGDAPFHTTEAKKRRIFISYNRGTDPDEKIAMQVYEALSKHHEVFMDQKSIEIGANWAKRIDTELRRADFLISFLSSSSVQSEMVIGEIEKAHHLAKEKGREGRPCILPVRVAYTEPFYYPLNAYLDHINWASWSKSEDTASLIEDLSRAVSSGEAIPNEAQPAEDPDDTEPLTLSPFPAAQLEMPEGTIYLQSKFYVERPSDVIALNAIRQQGVTITIKGPRQVGKSSLLIRVKESAVEQGKRVVLLDFQQISKPILRNAELLLRHFCTLISYRMKLRNRVVDYWSLPLDDIMRCTLYMEEYILEESGSPLVLAMDEVDTIFDTDFRSDFFGMLRSWHNSRADIPAWKRLDLALVTSTEPYQFIDEVTQSPFNVGETIEPEDFTEEQVSDLVRRHGLHQNLNQQLMALLSGHPYLVRRALYLLGSQRISSDDLFSNSTADRGPFGDHLRYHLFRLHDQPELTKGLLQIIRGNTCDDERVSFRLQSAGLVRRKSRKLVVPRCQLYAKYFREHLNV